MLYTVNNYFSSFNYLTNRNVNFAIASIKHLSKTESNER